MKFSNDNFQSDYSNILKVLNNEKPKYLPLLENQSEPMEGRLGEKYFVTMAKQKLGQNEDTKTIFKKMSDLKTDMETGESGGLDYQFINAKELPSREMQALPHYIAGLGYSGLGNKEKAREEFKAALAISPGFLNAKIALEISKY